MRRENLSGKFNLTPSGSWKCTIRKKVGSKTLNISATRPTKTQARQAAQAKLESLGLMEFDVKASKTESHKSVQESFTEYFNKVSATWQDSTKIVRNNFFTKMIINPLGEVLVKDLSPKIINELIDSWRYGYCNDNIKKSYNFLLNYLKNLDKLGLLSFQLKMIDERPKSVKDAKKSAEISDDKPLILDEDEFRKISLATYDDKLSYHALMFYLMLWTGLRGQEVRALTVNDIDFDNRTLKIDKAVSEAIENENIILTAKAPKTKNSKRVIGICGIAVDTIDKLIELRPDQNNDLICQNKYGTFISKRSFARFFDKVCRYAGIDKQDRSPHCLRHTFISYAIDQKKKFTPLIGKSQLFISEYVGHADLTTTLKIYAHISHKDLEDIPYNHLTLDDD